MAHRWRAAAREESEAATDDAPAARAAYVMRPQGFPPDRSRACSDEPVTVSVVMLSASSGTADAVGQRMTASGRLAWPQGAR